jgi:hypothetical protein
MFLLLLAVTPVKEIFGYYLALKYGNNSSLSNSFTLFEFFIFCLAFYIDSHIRIIWFLLIGLLLFSIINNILFQDFLTQHATNTTLLVSLFEIVFYFLYLILYFNVVDTKPLRVFPLFWIGLGVMVFSITSIVAFGFLQLSEKGSIWFTIAGYARQYSNYVLYLLFIPAFLSPQNRLCDFTGNK